MNRIALTFVLAFAGVAAAQSFPTKALNFTVPWSPGGSADLTSRALASAMSKPLGENVTVISRTGGGGAIGHLAISQARPTGYDIGMGTLEMVIPSWSKTSGLTIDNFTPISLISINPAAITVAKNSPFKTIGELVTFLKANPGKLKASGTAKGGSWDMARAGFLKTVGLKNAAMPWVPAQGSAAAIQELLAGGVDVITVSVAEVNNLLKSGEVRTLAVMADKRLSDHKTVPTLKESGINWSFGSFLSVVGPRRLSGDVVTKIDASIKAGMQEEEFKKFMTNAGFGMNYKNPAQFRVFLTQQAAKMREVQDFIDSE
ncbi:tripartite tricarboxylate transporter substrate binding protein [Deinococcus sp. QL22]|uniref:tripartite tricarboxylate transporter substrate binding protein n=1 Tax=Deinococcus sp. QL22 TaxID=2939437 RepID=UPI0020179707|nr:tripartite tricarboxylate transporter substrate binding protein [Deinococcus sp. QL22]UQN10257.1 tripartite tricarboxylate transporter substrate binding protein [Deinococcus sp. QL22]